MAFLVCLKIDVISGALVNEALSMDSMDSSPCKPISTIHLSSSCENYKYYGSIEERSSSIYEQNVCETTRFLSNNSIEKEKIPLTSGMCQIHTNSGHICQENPYLVSSIEHIDNLSNSSQNLSEVSGLEILYLDDK